MYELILEKERFKFSVSHFTILSKDRSERLHGHNYYVRVRLAVPELNSQFEMGIEMKSLKGIIQDICDELDERILIPQNSEFLKIEFEDNSVEVRFMDKLYVFPKEDCYFLPLANVSCEALAKYVWDKAKAELGEVVSKAELSIRVDESRGQGARYAAKMGLLPKPCGINI